MYRYTIFLLFSAYLGTMYLLQVQNCYIAYKTKYKKIMEVYSDLFICLNMSSQNNNLLSDTFSHIAWKM